MSATGSTPRITIDPASVDAELVAVAADALRAGQLVAIPTETVYGLGCNALDPQAVAGVFDAKARPASDPLIVHVDGVAMAETVTTGAFPAAAAILARAFWPGPLTMILPKADTVPDAVTSGGTTVGVRCPSHPIAAAIIAAAGVPVAAPSANRFGQISPTSAAHVVDELDGRIDLIVDAGRAEHGLESTVVAVHGEHVTVLRHGAITTEALAEHVTVVDLDADDTETRATAPGHDVRHYSPRTPTIATTVVPSDGPHRSVIYAGYDRDVRLPSGWVSEPLGSRDSLEAVAHDLYDNLRRLDARAPELIVVELSGAPGIGRAIDDRLGRAAAGIIATDADSLRLAVEQAIGD